MQQEFITIIEKLETDQYAAITVRTGEAFEKTIATNKTGAMLQAEYGGVEKFFESLIKQNIHKIAIQPRRKNGSSFKDAGFAQTFTIGSQNQTPMEQTVLPAVSYPAVPVVPKQRGAGLLGAYELELANYEADRRDKSRFEVENEFLKRENAQLKERVDEMKEERLQAKYDDSKDERKSKQTAEMLNGIAGPVIQMLAAKFLGGADVPAGLNAPTEQPSMAISEIKQYMQQSLLQASDDMNTFIADVFENVNKNAAFYDELSALLTKYNPVDGN